MVWGGPWSWLKGVHPWKEVTSAHRISWQTSQGIKDEEELWEYGNAYLFLYLLGVGYLLVATYVQRLQSGRKSVKAASAGLPALTWWYLWDQPVGGMVVGPSSCCFILPVCFTWQILKAGVANGAGVAVFRNSKTCFLLVQRVWMDLTGASCMVHLATSSCVRNVQCIILASCVFSLESGKNGVPFPLPPALRPAGACCLPSELVVPL